MNVSCVKLCGDMEDQPETSSALTIPVKRCRLGESDTRSRNKRTICKVYNFFQRHLWAPEHLSLHKTQDITLKACGVHHSTVQKIRNEAFISSSTIKYLLLPGKHSKENTMLRTWMTLIKVCYVRQCMNCVTRGNILQQPGRECRIFCITVFNLKNIKEDGFQI
jgi:hypothetical protein